MEDPFANHQRRGAEHGDKEAGLPAGEFVLFVISIVRFDDFGAVTFFFNGVDDGNGIVCSIGRPSDRSGAGIETDRGAANARDTLDRFGDVPGTIAARHAGHQEFRRDMVRFCAHRLWAQFRRELVTCRK
jgi:hypothetical protein